MTTLYGKNFSKKELLRFVGDISQIGGIRKIELADGNEKGVSAVEIATGTGFTFTILPDRGMDISSAFYCGKSLCWRSSTGDVHPAYYDPRGIEWLRSFYGGLLTTCGITNAGAPSVDNGEELGLHGRISNIPAKEVCYESHWEKDDFIMTVSGKLRETRVFGENLCLTRTITAKLGENRFFIHDEIENLGFNETPLMMLYHINGGYPAVAAGSELIAPVIKAEPRDDEAKKEMNKFNKFLPPTPNFKERVYYLDIKADKNGLCHAALVNRKFDNGNGFGFYVSYKKSQLPLMVEWKNNAEGTYVVGIEPSNCKVGGRAKVRQAGELLFIKPGEIKKFELEIGVLTGKSDIKNFEKKLK